jgi:hypothetical protein
MTIAIIMFSSKAFAYFFLKIEQIAYGIGNTKDKTNLSSKFSNNTYARKPI